MKKRYYVAYGSNLNVRQMKWRCPKAAHQKALDIIEGRKVDSIFYPVIYGADENDDWTEPKTWKKANPSLGITVGIDKVETACEFAKQNPAEENAFRHLRLNQWLIQVSENSDKLSDEFKLSYTSIPWRAVNGMEAAYGGVIERSKTIVCGHWHCSFGHSCYEIFIKG